MNFASDLSWRLRIRDVDAMGRPGEVLGTGFVVTEGIGMTCAHVTYDMAKCWVEVPFGDGETHLCDVRSVKPDWKLSDPSWTDVALIDVPRHLTPAPLGPLPPPGRGTVLDTLGFPRRYALAGDRGQRAEVHVMGPIQDGTLIQVDGGLFGGDGQIQPGYSGGGAVDTGSGRVVGMVASADLLRSPSPPPTPAAHFDPPPAAGPPYGPGIPPHARDAAATAGRQRYERDLEAYRRTVADQPALLKIAWIIPMASIARSWPPLLKLLPESLDVDPEYRRALTDISIGAYTPALNRLNTLVTTYQSEPDMFFYRVIAGLAGVRPGGYAAPMISAVERLLDAGLQTRPDAAHLSALRALVIEDYQHLRGLPYQPDWLAHLQRQAENIQDRHADTIIQHVPAHECWTYRRLKQKRGHW